MFFVALPGTVCCPPPRSALFLSSPCRFVRASSVVGYVCRKLARELLSSIICLNVFGVCTAWTEQSSAQLFWPPPNPNGGLGAGWRGVCKRHIQNGSIYSGRHQGCLQKKRGVYIYIERETERERSKYDSGTNIRMSQCVDHRTAFTDSHSKIPLDRRSFRSKAI